MYRTQNETDNLIKAMDLEIPPAPDHVVRFRDRKDMGRDITGEQRAERRFLNRMGVSSLDQVNVDTEDVSPKRRVSDKPSGASRRRSAIVGQQRRADRAGLRTTIGQFIGIGGATPSIMIDRLGDTL